MSSQHRYWETRRPSTCMWKSNWIFWLKWLMLVNISMLLKLVCFDTIEPNYCIIHSIKTASHQIIYMAKQWYFAISVIANNNTFQFLKSVPNWTKNFICLIKEAIAVCSVLTWDSVRVEGPILPCNCVSNDTLALRLWKERYWIRCGDVHG